MFGKYFQGIGNDKIERRFKQCDTAKIRLGLKESYDVGITENALYIKKFNLII